MKKLSLASLVILTLILGACSKEQVSSAVSAPPAVDVVTPLKYKITEWEEFTGRFEAVSRVDIRARVTGYLVEKKFRDGQMVKKGDVLFVIDPRPFEYAMTRVEAQYALADKAFKRAADLRNTAAISQEDFDRRIEEVKGAEASLNEAKLDVEFTRVTSPIDGKISEGFVDIGNLVRENETVLTRVVSVDPIHFEFESAQDLMLKYLRLDRAGKRASSDTTANPIFIKLQDENNFIHMGRMDFVDNIVDPGTGTIRGRALVENRDTIIYPGLFGRARLMGRANFETLLLPEKAINTDQNRKFVYIVSDENRATRSYITPGKLLDNGLVVVEDGLKGNERVVVDGMQRIRAPEQPVTPEEIPLEWVETEAMPDLSVVPSLEEIANMAKPAQPDSTAKEEIKESLE